MKTSTIPITAPHFYLIDAANERIGKVATKAAMILRGKHKATFSPHQLCGDHVIVINAAKLDLPPKKEIRKVYHRVTGYQGHMRTMTLGQAMEKDPRRVVHAAVKGMLESNRLTQRMLTRLHIFADGAHPYETNAPVTVSLHRSSSN